MCPDVPIWLPEPPREGQGHSVVLCALVRIFRIFLYFFFLLKIAGSRLEYILEEKSEALLVTLHL